MPPPSSSDVPATDVPATDVPATRSASAPGSSQAGGGDAAGAARAAIPGSGYAASEGHGGDLALAALEPAGVKEIFTLSGGHIFPFYDACRSRGWAVYDTRHEQTAVFAAEATAKLTRRAGVAVLTAGPGVTNGVSAITTASFNGSPLVVLAGRAAEARWGSGSLQELDHVPIVAPVTKLACTVRETSAIPDEVSAALACATSPHRGPVFLDFPLDVVFGRARGPGEGGAGPSGDGGDGGDGGPSRVPGGAGAAPGRGGEPDPEEVAKAARLLVEAECPALVVGSDVWWNGCEAEIVHLAEALRLPVFANGMGRGCLPFGHELSFSRARPVLGEADVVAVVGAPLDFRLGFGVFGAAQVVHIADHPSVLARHAKLAAGIAGDMSSALEGIEQAARSRPGAGSGREPWIARLRAAEDAARQTDEALLSSAARPVHPARVYGELRRRLDPDAVVIGDGGDFVSFAGRFVDSRRPGCWLDPGPYGCLGTGLGYAMAARVARPSSQVVLLAGDGAFGMSAMDVDSLVRHGLPVVIVVGNNGIWGLEKHPMQALYGYDIAADLQQGCRYDAVVEALGGAGETVEDPGEVGPALDRALASGVPYLVNVILDASVAYPRRSSLA